MWQKLKAACGHSLTVAVSFGLTAIGEVLQYLDTVTVFVTDQDVNAIISQTLGTDSKVLGRYLAVVGVITLFSRLRTLWRVTHV